MLAKQLNRPVRSPRLVTTAALAIIAALGGCEAPTSRAPSTAELLNETAPQLADVRSPVRPVTEGAPAADHAPAPTAVASTPTPPASAADYASDPATAPVPAIARSSAQPAHTTLSAPIVRTTRVELAGKDIFEAGTWVLTAESSKLLATQMRGLPRSAPLVVQVFNQPSPPRGNSAPKNTRDLSEVRAEKLAEYLRSAEGGSWTIAHAIGRKLDVVDGRQPDRRIEIFVAE